MRTRISIFFIVFAAQLAAQVPATDIILFDLGWNQRGRPVLSNPIAVTDRDGYDNQPEFGPEGYHIYYSSIREGQSDIFSYNVLTGQTAQITETKESEYSPKVMPWAKHLSVVRVEKDDRQRIWRVPIEGGKPRMLMDQLEPVGYYSWMEQGFIVMFILGNIESGEKNSLQICHYSKQRSTVLSTEIGRCLQPVPFEDATSFVLKSDDGKKDQIRKFNRKTGKVIDIAPALPGSEDYAWTPDGKLLMGAGSRLYYFDPAADARWHFGYDLIELGYGSFNRLAVSPLGDKVALVFERPDASADQVE